MQILLPMLVALSVSACLGEMDYHPNDRNNPDYVAPVTDTTLDSVTLGVTYATGEVPTYLQDLYLTPATMTNAHGAGFAFSEGDNPLPLECNLDDSQWEPCHAYTVYPDGLSDALHTFRIRGLDNGIPVSNTVTFTWIVDNSLPDTELELALVSAYGDLSVVPHAMYHLVCNEGDCNFECRESATASLESCDTPWSIYGLGAQDYTFTARAITDTRKSQPAEHTLTVELPNGPRWRLPDTGQTKCYNETSEIPECPIAGDATWPGLYPQDGKIIGPNPQYTNLDTGVVSEDLTGLYWEQHGPDGAPTGTWQEALAYCAGLTTAGFHDWRLPNPHELESLMYFGSGAIRIDTDFFPETVGAAYWSAYESAAKDTRAIALDFGTGGSATPPKTQLSAVRCLRGNNETHSQLTNDGILLAKDTLTSLMWEVKDAGTAGTLYTWAGAMSYCETLVIGGHNDWRLPNRRELLSIADPLRADPAMDDTVFTFADGVAHWSSTTKYNDPIKAYRVTFTDFGIDSGSDKPTNSVARCVRDAD